MKMTNILRIAAKPPPRYWMKDLGFRGGLARVTCGKTLLEKLT
jgi:hypothetical protein